MGLKNKFPKRQRKSEKHDRMRLIIVLPFLMALFSSGSAIFLLSVKTDFRWFQRVSADVIAWLVLIIVLSASAGLALAYGITSPLQELADKLEKIAAGNFMQPLDMAAEKEIESLAHAFNSMMASVNRYILEGMAGAAITVDDTKNVVSFNPVAEIVFGYAQDQVVGRPLSQVLPEEDGNQAFYALLDDAIKQGRNCIGQELKVITRQGESIEVKLSLSLLKGDSGVRVGILATFKNLAEIQRLREHLQRADQLMTLGTMTAGIAHEIRNPLGSISGLLQLLREDLSEDVQKTVYIDTIMQATDRINNLIEDMLTLANPSLGRTELRAINEVLHETIGFARFDNLAKRIEIVEQYDNQEPIVHMDAERLGQAFLNIVRNAFQATPEGGKITVETHCKVPVKSVDSSGVMVSANNNKPAVCIRLNNTGSYIPPENYRQIFTPFFSTKKEGSGLGLSITRQIILAHGGSIEVESTHESGTTFIIELPFADQEPAAA